MTGGEEPRQGLVLVADDDDSILSAIAFCLEDEGYAVATAFNGQEALTLAAAHRPCLILLDMKMPVTDGWEFAEAYRAQPGPHAPIIVMTAAKDTRSRAAEVGADGYLAKPFDVDGLLALVRRYAPVA